MNYKWEKHSIKKHVDILVGYPFPSKMFSDYEGIKLVRGTNVSLGFFNWDQTKYWNNENDEYHKYLLNENDILIGMDGSRVGKNRVRVKKEDLPLLLVQRVARLKAKENLDQDYLYYNIMSKNFSKYVNAIKTGSAVPHISQQQILEYEIFLPPLKGQKQISLILRKLDETINVNENLSILFGEICSIVFKKWFIDYNFPNTEGDSFFSNGGEMKESSLGLIPKKWDITKLENFGNIAGGTTPSTKIKEYWGGTVPWITPRDMSNLPVGCIYIGRGKRNITKKALDECSMRWFPKNSIIFSSRAPIGYIAIAENDLTCNQGFKNIIPHKEHYSEFLYFILKNHVRYFRSIAGGSTFREISGTTLKEVGIITPSDEVLKMFHITIKSLFKFIKNALNQNYLLSELRDVLSPRLMSGKIRVSMEESEV